MKQRLAPVEEKKPEIRRGLPLGWRLGLATATLVTAVLGAVSYFQLRWDLQRQAQDRRQLLEELLSPLVANLEAATSLEEIREQFIVFQRAFQENGRPEIQLELRNHYGEAVVSFFPEWFAPRPEQASRVAVPVVSALLNGAGTLTVWQDERVYADEAQRRFRFWGLNLFLVAVGIVLSLGISNRLLITRPLLQLVEGMRRLSRGDGRSLERISGPWEWRWLARRIGELGNDLEETVRRLVDAERRALRACLVENTDTAAGSPDEEATADDGAPPRGRNLRRFLMRRYLQDKLRLLEHQDPKSALVRRYAQEVWDHEVAEAERQGDIELRNRLDDAAFRILFPLGAERVREFLDLRLAQHQNWLIRREEELRVALKALNVPVLEIQHRIKHAAGIWRKMQLSGIDPDQVQDLLGLRVIVADEPACYRALEAIHRCFEPQPLRFRDYIASPKENGYQSIHTSVRDSQGVSFEVQIRSRAMHQKAERGLAAHWQYKARHREAAPENGRRIWRWLFSERKRADDVREDRGRHP